MLCCAFVRPRQIIRILIIMKREKLNTNLDIIFIQIVILYLCRMILDSTLDFIFTNNKNLTVDLLNQILIPTYCYHPVLELVLGINSHSQTFMTATCAFFCTQTNLHTCFCKYFYTVQRILSNHLQKLLFLKILLYIHFLSLLSRQNWS